jgi:hypothetical protein
MEQYKNLGGDSGVSGYTLGDKNITVQFKDGMTYKYTSTSAGINDIREMSDLATCGEGLNEYINRNVRKNYESKSGPFSII